MPHNAHTEVLLLLLLHKHQIPRTTAAAAAAGRRLLCCGVWQQLQLAALEPVAAWCCYGVVLGLIGVAPGAVPIVLPIRHHKLHCIALQVWRGQQQQPVGMRVS